LAKNEAQRLAEEETRRLEEERQTSNNVPERENVDLKEQLAREQATCRDVLTKLEGSEIEIIQLKEKCQLAEEARRLTKEACRLAEEKNELDDKSCESVEAAALGAGGKKEEDEDADDDVKRERGVRTTGSKEEVERLRVRNTTLMLQLKSTERDLRLMMEFCAQKMGKDHLLEIAAKLRRRSMKVPIGGIFANRHKSV
jgi:hypothetical protein